MLFCDIFNAGCRLNFKVVAKIISLPFVGKTVRKVLMLFLGICFLLDICVINLTILRSFVLK